MKKYFLILSVLLFVSCSKKQDQAVLKNLNPVTSKSSDKLILSFTLNTFSPAITATIDQSTKTISFIVPFGTDITNLLPTITGSANSSISPNSGVANNFTNPVQYTVTAEDGSKQVYTASTQIGKSPLKAITSFSFQGLSPAINGIINDTTKTITAIVPKGTDLSSLIPAISISAKAAITPATGIPQNFSSKVGYTVTAEDGSTQLYQVVISQAISPDESLAVQLITNATYSSTYGVFAQIRSAYHTFWSEIEYPKDTVVTAVSNNAVVPVFSYTSNWHNTQLVTNSSGNDPGGFKNSFTFTGGGNYIDNNSFSSNYTDSGYFVITYGYVDTPFILNYSRSEAVATIIGVKQTFTDKFTINSTEIFVNKNSGFIMSGTATVGLQLTFSGKLLSYNGTIKFSDNNQAVLQLNSGKSYPLQWQ